MLHRLSGGQHYFILYTTLVKLVNYRMKVSAALRRYKVYDVLVWAAIFGLWYFFRYQDYSSKTLAFNITLLKVADLAVMVYTTNYLLIPLLLYKKKYLFFGVLYVILVVGTSLLKMHIEGIMLHNPRLFSLANFKSNFYDNTIPHFLLVSTAAAFKLMFDYARAQRRIGEMAKENAEAELNFLKSQINPHFVFNSLNSVYFLIDKENGEARDALHKFSGMLRYQLYECNGHKTNIEKEITYLHDYIDMQRLRRDNCHIDFCIGDDVKKFAIEPLLLIPFVENAFKHLSHFTNRSNDVHIQLDMDDKIFTLKVTNTMDPKSQVAYMGQAGGIGLKNVQRRLQLLYPGRHTLTIAQQNDVFTVNLRLNITQDATMQQNTLP